MLDLFAAVGSTLANALMARDVAQWRRDQDQDPALAVFMLHLRLVEILESGHKVFVSLHADLRNHDRSQTFTTGPVPPFFVGEAFLSDVVRQHLNVTRFLQALAHLESTCDGFSPRARAILTRHGFGKCDPLTVIVETLHKRRLPLFVADVEDWLRAETDRRSGRRGAGTVLSRRITSQALDVQQGWTPDTLPLVRQYVDGGDGQRQLTRLSAAAEELQRVLSGNVMFIDVLPGMLRPAGTGSDVMYARRLLR